jgi:ribosome-binding protein aMBF1 (putative translation factor)
LATGSGAIPLSCVHNITLNSVCERFSAQNIAKYLRKFYTAFNRKRERDERKTDMLAVVATTGDKLRRERRGEGLTQAELAERSGVAQSTIAQIEGGARPNPHPRTLKKLAEALGVQTRELLED